MVLTDCEVIPLFNPTQNIAQNVLETISELKKRLRIRMDFTPKEPICRFQIISSARPAMSC